MNIARLNMKVLIVSILLLKPLVGMPVKMTKTVIAKWHDRWCMPKLKQCISSRFAQVIVAEAFYRVFWLDYMYTGRRWTEFRKSRLVILNEDIPIRRAITDKFIPHFDRLRARISSDKLKINDHVSRSQTNREVVNDLEKVISEIVKLIHKLLTESYRAQLVKSIKD